MFGLEFTASQLLYSTVMVVSMLANGQLSWGTAFFYQTKIDEQKSLQILVTNKHVVAGATTVKLRLHEPIFNKEKNRDEPSPESFELTVEAKDFINHPGDVDLCAVPFGLLRMLASQQGKTIFYIPLGEEQIPSDDKLRAMSALEDVVMVGYPIGLSDTVNNFPIIRKGVTASHPYLDFKGKPHGVADIATFPGSSGSPIIIHNENSYGIGDGLRVIGSRTLLIGILFAGPQYKADGTLEIREIPTAKLAVPVMPLFTHLGFYVKAKELKVLNQAVLKALKPLLGRP